MLDIGFKEVGEVALGLHPHPFHLVVPVEVLQEKEFEGAVLSCHVGAESHYLAIDPVEIVPGGYPLSREVQLGGQGQVVDEIADEGADGLDRKSVV